MDDKSRIDSLPHAVSRIRSELNGERSLLSFWAPRCECRLMEGRDDEVTIHPNSHFLQRWC